MNEKQGQVSALRKKILMRVPVQYSIQYSIVYIASRPGLRFGSANRVGSGSGRDILVVSEQTFSRFWKSLCFGSSR